MFAEAQLPSNVTIRFKGHKNVWTSPMLYYKLPSSSMHSVALNLTDTEGDYYYWEKTLTDANLNSVDGPLTIFMRQTGYHGDYYNGTLSTLPRKIAENGLYCFTAGNLNGEANISEDSNTYDTWIYLTDEQNYNADEENTFGRQCGMLFSMTCDDPDYHTYYASLEGKSDNELRDAITALTQRDKRVTAYMSLREAYAVTDYYTFGNLCDMYSYRSGTYRYPSGESGDYEESTSVYNREHSLVKSYWGHNNSSSTAQFTDIVHVIPTNGYVNTERGTMPYGETLSPTQIFGNGTRIGPSSLSGTSVNVFEPIDEYKGDIARIYFYMLTCYNTVNMTKNNNARVVFSYGSGHGRFTTYSKDLFMQWSRQDPISDKERNRNNGIQSIQGNRNPFVDLPNLAEYLWGEHVGTQYSFDDRYVTALGDAEQDDEITAWQYSGMLYVDCRVPARIEVFDVMGRLVQTAEVPFPQLTTLPSVQGVKIVRVTDRQGNVRVIKVL